MNYFSEQQIKSVMDWCNKIVRRVVRSAIENGVVAISDALVLREVALIELMIGPKAEEFAAVDGKFSLSFRFPDGDDSYLTGLLVFNEKLRLVALELKSPDSGTRYFTENDLIQEHYVFILDSVSEAIRQKYLPLETVKMMDEYGLLQKFEGKVKNASKPFKNPRLPEAAFSLFFNFHSGPRGWLLFNKHYELVSIDQREPVEKNMIAVATWYES